MMGSEGVMADKKSMSRRAIAEPIAIVGMGCRLPGADSPAALWRLLSQGEKAIRPVPRERWERSRFYDPDHKAAGKMNSYQGGFLEEIDRFDAAFFNIREDEAHHIDPQQRLFLEVAWEALEYAGIPPFSLSGSATSVFTGLCTIDYHRLLYRDFETIGPHSGTGTTMSITANRLSYLLDLRGPSMAIDAACSSALVGVHLGCQSLRTGESDLCIAGGVNLILSPDSMISSSQTGLLSAKGACRPFDAAADGYVRGEGCGVVILKRLKEAEADGDNVLAVIKGSAVNQDGLSNSLSAPNGRAQQALIARALSISGVSANDIDYVETHAVGTVLGDAIEFSALKKVLTEGAEGRAHTKAEGAPTTEKREEACLIGSLKPNLGHLEAASGIVSLIKVVLALQHEEIPPQLNFEEANSYLGHTDNIIEISTQGRRWARGERPRIAGISTFGFGGTNAHLVVAESSEAVGSGSVEKRYSMPDSKHHILCLSAKSTESLRSLAQKYCKFIDEDYAGSLADLCYTASVGRTHFDERLCFITPSLSHLSQQLRDFIEGKPSPQCLRGKASRRPPKVPPSTTKPMLTNLGERFIRGAAVDWQSLYQGAPHRKQPLPTYPYERSSYWFSHSQQESAHPKTGIDTLS